MLRLRLEEGEVKGTTFKLMEGENLAGRSHSAAICLSAPDVSGRHFKVTLKEGKATIENISRYGTLLNGRVLDQPTRLKPGQKIGVGKSNVLLVEEISDDEAPIGERTGNGFQPPDADLSRTMQTVVKRAEVNPEPPKEAVEDETGRGEDSVIMGEAVTGAGAGDVDLGDAATGAGDADLSEVEEAPSMTVVPPKAEEVAEEVPAGEAVSRESWTGPGTGGGTLDGHTRAMMTRAVGQEEIEYLRLMDRQRARRRMIFIGLGLLCLAGLAAFLVSLKPKPETKIAWPVDENGDFIQELADSPLGGFKVYYPKSPEAKVTVRESGLEINCMVGARKRVPLRIVLEELVDLRFVRENMDDSIRFWQEMKQSDKGKWNFDRYVPAYNFFGWGRGILFRRIPYQREENGSWFGVVSIFRNGRRFVAVRVEVPAKDRARAEDLLYEQYVSPSQEFIRSHWEGSANIPKAVSSEILVRLREELRRMAPATWKDVETQLVGAIQKAVIEGNTEKEDEAIKLLMILREKEALWYNEQRVQKEAAAAQGNEERVESISKMCQAVFSDMNDQRFFEVRKW